MNRLILIISVLFLTITPTLSYSSAPSVTAQETSHDVTPEMIAEFATLVESEIEFYNIPGVAVAIVQDNEVLSAEGFGMRNLETREPFTSQTRFRIGSTTKSMTSMLVAQLVDEGLFDWDTLVVDLYPDFQTADPELTARIRVRDLMGMNTGLETNGIELVETVVDWSVADLFTGIGRQTIGGAYGEHFSYNNEVYASAGYIAAQEAGYDPTLENYSQLMDERIFAPIGMTQTLITDDLTELGENYAVSYEPRLIDDIRTSYAVSPSPIGVIAPAGAVWASVEDMAHYVLTQMNSGMTPDGTQIVSPENLMETWQSQVTMPDVSAEMTDLGYGMGWVTLNYRDIPVRYHDGGWEGYRTQMVIFPDANVSLIIFTNHIYGDILNPALSFGLAEMLYDLEPMAINNGREQFANNFETINPQLASFPPVEVEPEDVADFLGAYENGWEVELREDNTLWLVRPAWEFMLRKMPFSSNYIAVNGIIIGTQMEFEVDNEGVTLNLGVDGDSISFAKLP